jgi:hypothetical protein
MAKSVVVKFIPSAVQTVNLGVFDITLTCKENPEHVYAVKLVSKLAKHIDIGAKNAVESMILAHFCAGIDVASPAYVQGIRDAVEAIANHE